MNQARIPYFENLDAIRFLAFMMVFMRHYYDFSTYQPANKIEHFLFENFIMNGGLGVNLFFVISGFLITYLLIYEKNNAGQINIKNFYIRRVLRIWPLYYLIIIINFFVVPLITHKTFLPDVKAHIPYYIGFINNFDLLNTGFAGVGDDGLAILWSIAVEEQFYFIWPVLLFFINGKYLPILFFSVILLCVIFRWINSHNQFLLYFHTLSVMSDLAIGGCVAYAAIFYKHFINFFRSLKKWQIACMYLLLLITITFHKEWSTLNIFTKTFERLFLSLLFAFVIAEQCFCERSLFKFGKLKILGMWGVISYGLYCFHLLNITVVQKINAFFHFDQAKYSVFYSELFFTLLLTILTAYSSFKYFEEYFLNFKHKFASK